MPLTSKVNTSVSASIPQLIELYAENEYLSPLGQNFESIIFVK
jgi:hypothetical protein